MISPRGSGSTRRTIAGGSWGDEIEPPDYSVTIFGIVMIVVVLIAWQISGCAERPNQYDVSCFDKDEAMIYSGECYAPFTDQNNFFCYDDGRHRYPTISVSIPTGGRCIILPKDQRGLTE